MLKIKLSAGWEWDSEVRDAIFYVSDDMIMEKKVVFEGSRSFKLYIRFGTPIDVGWLPVVLLVIWGSWALCGVPRGELRPPTASGDPLGASGGFGARSAEPCTTTTENHENHEKS